MSSIESRYRNLLENLKVGVFVSRPDGVFLEANDAVATLAGYSTTGEFLKSRAQNLYADLADREKFIRDLKQHGVVRDRIVRSVRTTGELIWVSLSATLLEGEDGAGPSILGIVEDVTERKASEETLRRSEERYRQLVDLSPDAVAVTNLGGEFLAVNPRFEALLGFEGVDEIRRLGLATRNLIAKPDRPLVRESTEKLFRGEIVSGLAARVLRKDGSSFPAEFSATLIRDSSGRPEAFLSTLRDITTRVQVETALIRSEAALVDAERTARFGHYDYDITKDFWISSPTLDEIFGIGPGYSMTAAGWLALVHPLDRDLMQEYFVHQIIESGGSFDREYRICRANNGEIRWVWGLGRTELDSDGRPARMFGTIQDVTDRKNSEAALVASEHRFRKLFEESADAIFWADPESGLLVEANRAAELLVGRSRTELIGMLQSALHPPQESERYEGVFREHSGGEGGATHEGEVVHSSGRRIPVSIRGTVVEIEGRRLLQGVFRDETETRRAQAALAESEERLREILERIGDCVYSVRMAGDLMLGEVEYVGPQIERIAGIQPEQFRRDPGLWFGLIHPDDKAAVMEVTRSLADGPKRLRRDYRIKSMSTGQWRWIADEIESYADASGRVVKLVGAARDVTVQKLAEEALKKSQRDLGNYHDLITHDLSNFSMKLLGLLELLLSGAAGRLEPAQEELLRKANRQGLELERLASNARLLSRIDELGGLGAASRRLLSDVVKEAVDGALSIHFDQEVRAVVDVSTGLGTVSVPFLDQVLLNLVDNAIRYSPPGAPIRFEIAGARTEARDGVLLTVRGGRLAEASFVEQMFDRYVRGPQSSGSGLGLAAARAILEVAGGSISARAIPDEGGHLCEIRLEVPVGA